MDPGYWTRRAKIIRLARAGRSADDIADLLDVSAYIVRNTLRLAREAATYPKA